MRPCEPVWRPRRKRSIAEVGILRYRTTRCPSRQHARTGRTRVSNVRLYGTTHCCALDHACGHQLQLARRLSGAPAVRAMRLCHEGNITERAPRGGCPTCDQDPTACASLETACHRCMTGDTR